MKKQVLVLLLLVAVLVSGGSISAMADSYGKITGGIQYTMELYAPYPELVWTRAWTEVNVIEVEPWVDAGGQTHNAKGWFRFKTYHENTGWLSGRVDVSCVQFGEDDDGSYAVTSGKVVSLGGMWDLAVLGTYWVHKLYDNGTPGRDADLFTYFVGDASPGWSYDAVCNPGGSPDYTTGWHLSYPVEKGNLVIHH